MSPLIHSCNSRNTPNLLVCHPFYREWTLENMRMPSSFQVNWQVIQIFSYHTARRNAFVDILDIPGDPRLRCATMLRME